MSKNKTEIKRKHPDPALNERLPEKTGPLYIKYKLFGHLLNGLLLLFFIFYFYRIFSFMEETYFWGDENVHAYVTSVILKTHQIPFTLPDEIYGLREFLYPPLFHIFSALAASIAGFSILKYINLLIMIFFLGAFYTLIRRYYGHYEAAIASLLLSLSSVVAVNTVRFMTDMLSMVLMFFSFFFFLLSLQKSKKSFALLAGLSTGLLLLSKQVGIVVLGFYFILMIWFLLRKNKDFSMVLIVIGASVGVYIPYFILTICHKVDVFGYLSLLSGSVKKRPEWAIEAVRSFRRYDSSLKEFAHLFYTNNGFIISISIIIPLYYFTKIRSKDHPHHYVLLLLACLIGAMITWHITNARHTITLLPLLAFLAAYSFVRLAARRDYLVRIAVLLLIIIAGYFTYRMPNYRKLYNAPEGFKEVASIIKEEDLSGDRVFCIYAFDILMYTGKPVIWPYPDLKNIPFDLVENQDAHNFYRSLKKYQVRYICLDSLFISRNNFFNGRSYPIYLYNNCISLIKEKKMSPVALSKSRRFLLLLVI